jgi:uncharacterized protein (TIGR02246 family)
MTRLWTTALVLVLALAASASANSPRENIEEALATFAAAFNGGDGAGVAALYTDDAALLPPGGERVDGRAAIETFWQGAIDGGLTNLTLRVVEVEAKGDIAYEVGALSLQVPGEDGQPVTVEGKYIVVWQKGADGTWRLHRDIWNMSPAAE